MLAEDVFPIIELLDSSDELLSVGEVELSLSQDAKKILTQTNANLTRALYIQTPDCQKVINL